MIIRKYNYTQLNNSTKSNYIALGFFDGIHLGHQALLYRCKQKAKKDQALSSVILFNPHPEKIIHQMKHFFLLTPLKEKIQFIKQTGIDQIILIHFNKIFQKISAENFVGRVLSKHLNMKAVFLGYNYHFGYKKRGDIHLIEQLSNVYHYQYLILNPVLSNNEHISSTRIKKLLNNGCIEKANQMLGYYYQLSGKVIQGDHRGGPVLSFPTANIQIHPKKLIPHNGIYLAKTRINDHAYQGLVNIGFKPTFYPNQKNKTIEMNIFDFNQDIYGKTIHIELLKKIRNEKKFSSTQQLKSQMMQDKKIAEKLFKNTMIKKKINMQ